MTRQEATEKTLNLYPIDYPFETLSARIRANPPKLQLNPDFQRKYKWDKEGWERASRFIESCLMRIPLPACYFAENTDGSHLVIDGVQRLTTIQKFFDDGFSLEGMTAFQELEGKKFSEIGSHRADLEATTIRCIILRKENPKSLVQEIFSRLNQGAVKLSDQEIRHAIYPGTLNNLLLDLATNPTISSFGNTEKDSREGEELVLRFFAPREDGEEAGMGFYEGLLFTHIGFGSAAVLLGVFIALRANGWVPRALQFKNYKTPMWVSYGLYMVAIFLGVWVYIAMPDRVGV
jgi:hypothetical protein